MSILTRALGLFDRILKSIGLERVSLRRESFRSMEHGLAMSSDLVRAQKAMIHELETRSVEEQRRIDELNMECRILEDRAKRAEEELRYVKNIPEDTMKYVESVQKQLSSCFHESEAFGFPRHAPYPGSISVQSTFSDIGEDRMVTLRTRMITLDNMTEEINAIQDTAGKIGHIIGTLGRYGLLSSLVDRLVRAGAVLFHLGFNADSELYEVYCEIEAKVRNEESIMTFPEVALNR